MISLCFASQNSGYLPSVLTVVDEREARSAEAIVSEGETERRRSLQSRSFSWP